MKKSSVLLVILLLVSLLGACSPSTPDSQPSASAPSASQTPASQVSSSGSSTVESAPPTKITITTTGFATDILDPNNIILNELERLTNSEIDLQFIPDKSYAEKFSALVASNSLTDVMYAADLVNNAVMSAIKGNAFWKLNDYIPQLPNISQVDPELLKRSSLEGDIYGFGRDRQIGRLGIFYRKDWADKLGIAPPSTIDEFYEMARAFTYDDPDGNGENDTFGISEGKSMGQGSFANISCWFGAGAGGGPARSYMLDANNNVIPAFSTEEFIDAMTFMSKLYGEGIINQDFISVSSRADSTINGKAGISMGAMSDAASTLEKLRNLVPEADFGFVGCVDAGHGLRAAAENAGYKGYYLFSKTTLKDEEALMKVLMVFDAMNTVEVNNLLEYGIEGTHYTLKDNIVTRTPEQIALYSTDKHDIGQIRTFNLSINPCYDVERTPIEKAANDMILENDKRYIVGVENGLYSDEMAKNGALLQQDIDAAHAQFVMGQIDEAAWRAAVQKWFSGGGEKICKELTESYQKLMAS